MKIVLAHGVLGFGVIDVANHEVAYFKGVKEHFESRGHKVIEPAVNPIAPVTIRAAALSAAIRKDDFATKESPACIIAHSMGGLDARHALQDDDLRARVFALVTIGTPHLGSPIANILSAAHELHSLLNLDTSILSELEKTIALHDLTTDAAVEFEHHNPDKEGVARFYIAGVGRPTRPTLLPLPQVHTSRAFAGPFAVLAAQGLKNDGVVSIDSARRGDRDLMDTWPVDHAEEVGWDLDHPKAAGTREHFARYDAIIETLGREPRASS